MGEKVDPIYEGNKFRPGAKWGDLVEVGLYLGGRGVILLVNCNSVFPFFLTKGTF